MADRADSASQRAQVVDLVLSRLPESDATTVAQIVNQLPWGPARGPELLEHLHEHDDALVSGCSGGPTSALKLLEALAGAYPGLVARPRCVRCGREGMRLLRKLEGQRACDSCAAKSRTCVCVRCGREGIIALRLGDGYMCRHCFNRDTSRREACSTCGKNARVVRRDPKGRPWCQTCYPRPRDTCSACGRDGQKIQARTPDGPLCPRCYHRRKVATCTACGEVSSVVHRRPDTGTWLCTSCWSPTPVTCVRCGADQVIKRSTFSNPVCDRCRRLVRRRRECVECGETKHVHTRLAHGPVCGSCYTRLRAAELPCAACGQTRPLIGRDACGQRVCGPCSGEDRDWICQACGRFAALFADGRCTTCVAHERVRARLSRSDGTLHPQLEPFLQLLDIEGHPRSVIAWLHRSAWGQELGAMANRGEVFSHAALDALPNTAHVMHLRAALVYAGVLPERDEHIESAVPWIERFLDTQPAHIAAVLRRYAVWSVLRRARGRARRRVAGRGASKYVRNLIVLAAELMNWLDHRGIVLTDLSQGNVDEWLSEGGINRQRVRDFLRWAATQKLVPSMRIPVAARTQPDDFLQENQRWEGLSRCAHDDTLDLEVRVAAALVLLFGLTPTRIVRLTVDDITTRDDAVLLLIGKSPLPLPGPVAELVRELKARAISRPAGLLHRSEGAAEWLFPGALPGRHLRADTIATRTTESLGVQIRPARNAALCALAQDIPAPVLAQVLGLGIEAAERWSNLVKPDWSAYLAARDQRSPGRSTQD